MFAWILNTKPVKRSSVGLTMSRVARARLRRRRELDERAEERLEAEVGHRAAEEHRRLAAARRYSATSKRVPAARITSSDSRNCA